MIENCREQAIQNTFESALLGVLGEPLEKHRVVGVAVSGGSDSLALLHLLNAWGRKTGKPIRCVTVNHQLREEAAEEATYVADICEGLGITHDTLVWDDWNHQGNTQAQARDARRRLIGQWAIDNEIDVIALGHTKNDLVENFLIRLCRDAGVDGLAAMAESFTHAGAMWIRPLLSHSRECLREYLTDMDVGWIDDPSNDEVKYERIKMRQAMPLLEQRGLKLDQLVDVAIAMRDARLQREVNALNWASHVSLTPLGNLRFSKNEFLNADQDIQRRILIAALKFMSHADYPVRAQALAALQASILKNRTHTIGGCVVETGETIEIMREQNAMAHSSDVSQIYDNRWELTGDFKDNYEIGPLGEGFIACPDWRETGASLHAIKATPAVWQGEQLVAAPLAGLRNGFKCRLIPTYHDFLTVISAH